MIASAGPAGMLDLTGPGRRHLALFEKQSLAMSGQSQVVGCNMVVLYEVSSTLSSLWFRKEFSTSSYLVWG